MIINISINSVKIFKFNCFYNFTHENMSYVQSKKFLVDFVAGGLSGVVSKTIAAPIERVKLLLQTQKENAKLQVKYKGIIDCAARCVKNQGFFSLWRGNWVNVIRYFPTQALNFSFKDYFGRIFKSGVDKSKRIKYTSMKILSGGLAGSMTTFFVHPLDYARTRIAVDLGKAKHQRQFTGLWSCLSKTFKHDGIRGLYKGLDIAVCSIFIYRGLYFGLYDATRDLVLSPNSSLIIRLAFAQGSVIIAQLLSYPGDTVKRKMMMQTNKQVLEYSGPIECFKKVYASQGLKGFWVGAASNVLRGLGSAICLILFDEMKTFMNQQLQKH